MVLCGEVVNKDIEKNVEIKKTLKIVEDRKKTTDVK
jgi:hypothetical protein